MKNNIKNLCTVSLMAALMAVCAWITIPFVVPFTLQSFALFLCLLTFGGKKSLICTALYILLGVIGLPVFSSFGSGFGVLFGASGGFLLGFLVACALYWCFGKILEKNDISKISGCLLSMVIYTICGTMWYSLAYSGADISAGKAFLTVALPFLLPDIMKLFIAYRIYLRLKKAFGAKER